MIAFGKSHNSAVILFCNSLCTVSTLHIANQNFIKPLNTVKHLLQMLLGVICINDYRNLIHSG